MTEFMREHVVDLYFNKIKNNDQLKDQDQVTLKNIAQELENGLYKLHNPEHEMQLYLVMANKIYTNINYTILNKLISKEWNPSELVNFTRETLKPLYWQKLQEDRLPKSKIERVKGTNKCPRCKSWFTTYKQAQTRSGDEGLTTRCACDDCGHHWKF